MNLLPYLQLLRPKQWVKNFLVFAPAFFAGTLLFPDTLLSSIAAFTAFSLAASAIYILNDVVDCAHDAKHPKKCLRPLPSGKAKVPSALVLSAVLAALALYFAFQYPGLLPVLFAYLLLNLAYSLYLKKVAVVDIVLVAFFYVLRVVAGGAATGIELSPWIVLATFFLALFLISAKRRGELSRAEHRSVLKEYAPEALTALLIASAALALASYGVWSVLAHPASLAVYSVVPVAAVLFRMLNFLFLHPEEGESPEEVVFKDKWVFGLTLLWVASVFGLFYLS